MDLSLLIVKKIVKFLGRLFSDYNQAKQGLIHMNYMIQYETLSIIILQSY